MRVAEAGARLVCAAVAAALSIISGAAEASGGGGGGSRAAPRCYEQRRALHNGRHEHGGQRRADQRTTLPRPHLPAARRPWRGQRCVPACVPPLEDSWFSHSACPCVNTLSESADLNIYSIYDQKHRALTLSQEKY